MQFSAEAIEYEGTEGAKLDAVIPLLIDIKIIMTISKEITAYKLKLKNYNTRYNLGRLYYLHLICYVYLHPQAFYITVLS